jgi:hypothetical protein
MIQAQRQAGVLFNGYWRGGKKRSTKSLGVFATPRGAARASEKFEPAPTRDF